MIYRWSDWNKAKWCKKDGWKYANRLLSKNLSWCKESDVIASPHTTPHHQFTSCNMRYNGCSKRIICSALRQLQLLMWGCVSPTFLCKSDDTILRWYSMQQSKYNRNSRCSATTCMQSLTYSEFFCVILETINTYF